MSKKKIIFDTADTKDYSAITIIDIKKNTIESRILSSEKPDPNSWLCWCFEEIEKMKMKNYEGQTKTIYQK